MVEQRESSAGAQHPGVMVLGCADSRVPPELIFDRGVGEMFAKILYVSPDKPTARRPDLPQGLEDVILKCMAREVTALLGDEPRRRAMCEEAYRLGREMIWEQSAGHYMESFHRARLARALESARA